MGQMSEVGQRFYEDDEAEQILRVAASMSSSYGGMSFDRLVETAAELGISPEAVAQAEQQVMTRRHESRLLEQFDSTMRRGFWSHLASYISINAALITMNLLTSPHDLWFYWPLLGWGCGLVGHALTAFNRNSEGYRRQFVTWKAQREGTPSVDQLSQLRDESANPKVVIGVHISTKK